MIRALRWSALLVLLLPFGVAAQDRQDPKEREERLKRRIAEALDGELRHLRDSLGDTVRDAIRGGVGGGTEAALDLVTEDLLSRHAHYIASDELEGRNAGYPGNDKVCEYISTVMRKAGLKPAGDNDEAGQATYYQHFDVFGRRTQNCLGLLEGTDPVLKKEIMVIGAHHDHVGTDEQRHIGRLGRSRPDDKIWNGADDNGSGTTSILGLVKAFGEGGIRTKRTILFMTFSGEEGGLLGSAYYVRHPIASIKSHVFMINMDMVGRNPERPCELMGWGSAKGNLLREAFESAARKTGLAVKLKEKSDIMGGDSDHSSFKNAGVPIANFFTGLHADYHTVNDTADKLDYPHMVQIARTAADLLVQIGNAAERPTFKGEDSDNDFHVDPENTPPPPPRRVLGISKGSDPTDAELDKLNLPAGDGALRIDTVNRGGAADAAGMKTGDLLISLGGKSFLRRDALTSLKTAIARAEAGKDVEAVVIRNGERLTLNVRWDN